MASNRPDSKNSDRRSQKIYDIYSKNSMTFKSLKILQQIPRHPRKIDSNPQMTSRDGSHDMEAIFHRHLSALFSLPKAKATVRQGGAAEEAIERPKDRKIERSKRRK
jgi:hypothetical protein